VITPSDVITTGLFGSPRLRLDSWTWKRRPSSRIARPAMLLGLVLAASAMRSAPSLSGDEQANWAQWRGPLGTGESASADPPVTWSETENIRWKTEIPGLGHSTPIVWEDRIFVTSAIPIGEALAPVYSDAPGAHDNLPVTHRVRFVVIAVSRRDGHILWQRVLHEQIPHEAGHFTASLASASPVTDGEKLYVFFGSHGLFALDLDGNLLWQKQLGTMQTRHGHGEGSSPVLHDLGLVVNWDHEGKSFIVAMDKSTGEVRWRQDRAEVTSWSTPLIVTHRDRVQVVVAGTNRLRGYDLISGEVIWECGGLSRNIVATPVAADGMLYAGSSYDTRALLAIDLDEAHGDITDTSHIAWSRTRATPYVPSPLLYRGSLYFLRHYQGILTRVDAKTGDEPQGPFRLGSIRDVYSSPVASAGRIYITDRAGLTLVITADEVPRTLSVNQLDDGFNASAALSGDEIILRGEKYLYCIGTE